MDSTKMNARVSGTNSDMLSVGDELPLEWRRFMDVWGEKSNTNKGQLEQGETG